MKLLLLLLLLLLTATCLAQGPGLPGEDPDVPIDGGMFLLMAAGLAYGVKTLRRKQ